MFHEPYPPHRTDLGVASPCGRDAHPYTVYASQPLSSTNDSSVVVRVECSDGSSRGHESGPRA